MAYYILQVFVETAEKEDKSAVARTTEVALKLSTMQWYVPRDSYDLYTLEPEYCEPHLYEFCAVIIRTTLIQ